MCDTRVNHNPPPHVSATASSCTHTNAVAIDAVATDAVAYDAVAHLVASDAEEPPVYRAYVPEHISLYSPDMYGESDGACTLRHAYVEDEPEHQLLVSDEEMEVPDCCLWASMSRELERHRECFFDTMCDRECETDPLEWPCVHWGARIGNMTTQHPVAWSVLANAQGGLMAAFTRTAGIYQMQRTKAAVTLDWIRTCNVHGPWQKADEKAIKYMRDKQISQRIFVFMAQTKWRRNPELCQVDDNEATPDVLEMVDEYGLSPATAAWIWKNATAECVPRSAVEILAARAWLAARRNKEDAK